MSASFLLYYLILCLYFVATTNKIATRDLFSLFSCLVKFSFTCFYSSDFIKVRLLKCHLAASLLERSRHRPDLSNNLMIQAQTTLHGTSPILKTLSHHQPRSCTSDGVDVIAPKLTFRPLQVVSHSGLLTDLVADLCNNCQVLFHIISMLFQHSLRLISIILQLSFLIH